MTEDTESGRRHASAYAQLHMAGWVARHYDDVMYAGESYDSFIWSVERPVLRRAVAAMRRPRGPFRYLDFACGTGRIVSALEDLADQALGVDISSDMLSAAGAKVEHARLRAGDLLEDPDLAAGPYDLVTAFRFFLNTEPEMRARVMPALASRLAGPDARLIFNIHQNKLGMLVNAAWRRLHGWPALHALTYWDARRLTRSAGLEIEAWYGFGLFPDRLYRGRSGPIARAVDRLLAGRTPLRWLSRDLVFVCRRRPASS